MATPPDSVPSDNGTALLLQGDERLGLQHEGVAPVTLACEEPDAGPVLWLTLGGGTEVGRTAGWCCSATPSTAPL